MNSYLILLIFLLILNKIKIKKLYKSIIGILPIFFMLAFKGAGVGIDTKVYNLMYYEAIRNQLNTHFDRIEIGFKTYINILSDLNDYPQMLYFVSAIIISLSLFYISNKFSNKPIMVFYFYITLGIFAFNLTGLRQSIAMAICLFSVTYILNRKFIRFIIVILIASSFHLSAFFFLPSYFIAYNGVSKLNILIKFLVIGLIFILSEQIIPMISILFSYEYGIERTNNGYVFLIIVIIITFLALVHRKKLFEKSSLNIFLLNMNFVTLLMWILRLVTRTAERPSFYYLVFTAILFERTLDIIPKNKYKLIANITAVIVTFILFVYRLQSSTIVPYYMNLRLF